MSAADGPRPSLPRRAAALLALAGVASLAGCGRAGPPRPPGPPERVIFPRAYPNYPRQPVPQGPGARPPSSSGAPPPPML
ncbi:hypothetical protein [Roseicella aquatilis]|uniref:Uncharacterized protein n=1 Tax=Roseicella aquatilis TaxID=2527868 RepID=A0A4R4D2G8_9PROT|nr:hypothetical protein [Roseicella aquatilis]TCZ52915.1 hypothetical protein EXY23_25770 [Roseicella aquatilis]